MTVKINAKEWCYPHFKDGQVLTHNDLNQLRDFLYSKTLFHARALIGFGVGCGLDGTVANGVLTLGGGFGIAQGGLELILPAEPAAARTFTLASAPHDPAVYPFIDARAEGVTAILRPKEVVELAGGECTAEGCTTHTERHCQLAEIVLVSGRLKLDAYESHPAFNLRPVIVGTRAPSTGDFNSLRDALARQLDGLVAPETRDLLKALTLTGPIGIDLLKVGIVNEVLYTLWDYLQCRRADQMPCFGMEGEPAIALGHASGADRTWTWDPTYRHHFRLSLSLHRAIRGFRGQDLCVRYLDRIRSLIDDFTPPPIPDDPDETEDPEIKDVCTLKDRALGLCPGWHGEFEEAFPPRYWIDPLRKHELIVVDPLWDPRPDEDILLDPWQQVEEYAEIDPVGVGTLSSMDVLGRDAAATLTLVKGIVKDKGLDETKVTLVSEAEFTRMADLQPALLASVSDEIVFGANDAGAIVGMGKRPTSVALGQVTGLRADAHQALGDSALALEGVAHVDGRVATLEGGFQRFEEEALPRVGEQIRNVRVALSREIEELRINSPEVTLVERAVQVADDVNVMRASLERLEGRYSADVAKMTERVDEVSRRFDAQAVRLAGGVPGERQIKAENRAILRTVERMTAAIRSAGGDEQELAAVISEVEELSAAAPAGLPLTEAEPEALTAVLEGMANVLPSAGVERGSPEYRALERSLASLKSSLGLPG